MSEIPFDNSQRPTIECKSAACASRQGQAWLRRPTILLLAYLLIVSQITTVTVAGAAEELSNASVIEMKQLGLGDTLIIDKIKASKCNFDLTIPAIKQLKEANVADSIISAMLAANKPSQAQPANNRTEQTSADNEPLPQFYGLYAVMDKRLVALKTDTAATVIQPDVEFLYYAKTVSAAESLSLLQVPYFLTDSKTFSLSQAGELLQGYPNGSQVMEWRAKPVPGQPEMMRLVPTGKLPPGNYQIGIPGIAKGWFYMRISIQPTAKPNNPQVYVAPKLGPPLHVLRTTDVVGQLEIGTISPDVRQNPGWKTIENAVDAMGGITNIMRGASTRAQLKGRIWLDKLGFVDTTCVFYSKYPDQLRNENTVHVKGGSVQQILSFSNGEAYGFSSGKPFTPAEMTKEMLRNETFMQRAESLRPLLEGRFRFTFNDEVSIGGKSFPSVSVFDEKYEMTLLFDPDSHLVARRRYSKLNPKGKRVPAEVVYFGYKKVNGLMVPSHIEAYEDGKLRQETDLEKIVLLQDIPAPYFTDPSLAVPY